MLLQLQFSTHTSPHHTHTSIMPLSTNRIHLHTHYSQLKFSLFPWQLTNFFFITAIQVKNQQIAALHTLYKRNKIHRKEGGGIHKNKKKITGKEREVFSSDFLFVVVLESTGEKKRGNKRWEERFGKEDVGFLQIGV